MTTELAAPIDTSVTAPLAPEAKPAGGETAVPAVPVTEKPAEKTFTQAELERELGKRLAIQERRRARELQADVERLKAQDPKPQQQAAPDAGAPKRDDYDSYEDFIRAEARHVAGQEFEAREAAKEKAASEAKVKAEREASVKTFDDRLKATAQKHEDFEEVFAVAQTAHITDAMFDAMTAADEGAEIAYYFGKHPEEAHRIAQLSLKAQAVEIGKLAVKVADGATAPPSKPESEPTKASVSQAPAPIVPGGSKATVHKDPKDMSYPEFVQYRRRQLAQKR